jgi:hypothetical protein
MLGVRLNKMGQQLLKFLLLLSKLRFLQHLLAPNPKLPTGINLEPEAMHVPPPLFMLSLLLVKLLTLPRDLKYSCPPPVYYYR